MSLLGIDLGTTTCKAAVFDTDGVRLAQALEVVEAHDRSRPGP